MRNTMIINSRTSFGRFAKITLSVGNHVLRLHDLPVMPCVDLVADDPQRAQAPLADQCGGRCKSIKHLSYWRAERPSSLAFAT